MMHLHHFSAAAAPDGNMASFVSVIIPNRNRAATLEKCLEAALASRYERFEVIVADDASGDESAAVAARFPCRLVRLEAHGGAARARNAGARVARGEILFFTDADCLLPSDGLSVAVQALARAGPDAAVGGTYTALPYDQRFFSVFQSVFIHYSETRNPRCPDYLATHALAMPAQLFARSGGFREDFLPILEDVEFSHRLRRMGCRLVMEPALQVQHIFGFTLRRSLANAVFKAKWWTVYSIGNRDLFADSGTASLGLKLNGAVYCAGLIVLALCLASGSTLALGVLAATFALNLYVNRGLLRAFLDHGGAGFALAASAYYLLLYPLAVSAGAGAGVATHLAAALGPKERR